MLFAQIQSALLSFTMATLERRTLYAKVVCIGPRRSALVLIVRSCGPSPGLISGGNFPVNRHVSKVWRPISYCLDFNLEEYHKGLRAGSKHGTSWIAASFEAFQYIEQEIEVVPHAREMVALTWLTAHLSGNRPATGRNGLVKALQWHWVCLRKRKWQCRKLAAEAANAGVAPTLDTTQKRLFGVS